MTLTVYNELEQGSPEWLEARRGILTASVIGQFVTPKTIKPAGNDKSRAMAYQLVAERITGIVEDRYISYEMEAGHFREVLARNFYSEHITAVEQVGFMTNEINGHKVGYSPDGTVGNDGLIEVKSHLPKLHLAMVLADEIPAEHVAQCQAGLLISGRAWIDYVGYCGGWPLFVKRMYPDARWIDAITEVVTAFEESAETMLDAFETATHGLPVTERVEQFQEIEIA